MKKLITIMAVLIASLSSAKSQGSFAVPLGVSSLKCPTIGVQAQIEVRHVVLAAGVDAQMSRDIMKGNFYWSRMGISLHLSELNSVEVAAGMGQYRRSSDVKSLNMGLALVNVQYVHELDPVPNGALFASVTGTKEFFMFTGGLRFIFGQGGGKQNYGCPANSRMY